MFDYDIRPLALGCSVSWVVTGPIGSAVDLAVRESKRDGHRYRIRRRKIGSIYLRDLDGTPVWDVIKY
jgi:hypothetical protein